MINEKIIVIDFGSQYNQLIIKNIRDAGFYSEIYSYETKVKDLSDIDSIKGIILSGEPHFIDNKEFDWEFFRLGLPILGICYGMQLIVKHFGGKILSTKQQEHVETITLTQKSQLVEGLSTINNIYMSYGDIIEQISEPLKVLAHSISSKAIIIEHQELPIYGVQFYPNIKQIFGETILKNFFSICNIKPNWSMENYIDFQVNNIKEIVQSEKVLMGISGGVDSSVAAVLIHKAIGNQLTCMFIDHGLLRKNEADEVMDMFTNTYHIQVIKIDAKQRFLTKLKGITDPEQKRKIIGNEFVYVFEEESKKIGEFAYLGQGTIYPDIIESGTKTVSTIKSHHNVGGLPKNMKFKLIEPLKLLFKDEVRKLGEALGINVGFVKRQPFPGPGLAIRVLGEITNDKLEIVRKSDSILREEIKKADLDKSIWQYFTLLPDIKSVGVMGDKRTYSHTVAIRAVTSIDGMTADWARIPYEVLEIISQRIVNEVANCNRVVLDITSKPPATIEWE